MGQSRTPYEKWQDTVKQGITDIRWDEYDAFIKTAVCEVNERLGKKSRNVEKPMPPLDWKWVKAIIWVESGGPENASWKTRPMQIGNPADPAFGVLKKGGEASSIIMSEALKSSLTQINTPKVNIKAGIAYLLNRLSLSNIKSLRSDLDKQMHEYTVVAKDNFSKIAKKKNTTVEELKRSNPTASVLKIGQKLKYYKASKERVITGWRTISAVTIAEKYNVGDPKYSKKLTYVLRELFPQKKGQKAPTKTELNKVKLEQLRVQKLTEQAKDNIPSVKAHYR